MADGEQRRGQSHTATGRRTRRITAGDITNRADVAGVLDSQAHIEALIAREKERGIEARRIVLAGFSQGGVIALYTGVRHAERLAGIVALSTYVVLPDRLAEEGSAANRDVFSRNPDEAPEPER